jgi:hypothetical protein
LFSEVIKRFHQLFVKYGYNFFIHFSYNSIAWLEKAAKPSHKRQIQLSLWLHEVTISFELSAKQLNITIAGSREKFPRLKHFDRAT